MQIGQRDTAIRRVRPPAPNLVWFMARLAVVVMVLLPVHEARRPPRRGSDRKDNSRRVSDASEGAAEEEGPIGHRPAVARKHACDVALQDGCTWSGARPHSRRRSARAAREHARVARQRCRRGEGEDIAVAEQKRADRKMNSLLTRELESRPSRTVRSVAGTPPRDTAKPSSRAEAGGAQGGVVRLETKFKASDGRAEEVRRGEQGRGQKPPSRQRRARGRERPSPDHCHRDDEGRRG